jgi:hypothetical protein
LRGESDINTNRKALKRIILFIIMSGYMVFAKIIYFFCFGK